MFVLLRPISLTLTKTFVFSVGCCAKSLQRNFIFQHFKYFLSYDDHGPDDDVARWIEANFKNLALHTLKWTVSLKYDVAATDLSHLVAPQLKSFVRRIWTVFVDREEAFMAALNSSILEWFDVQAFCSTYITRVFERGCPRLRFLSISQESNDALPNEGVKFGEFLPLLRAVSQHTGRLEELQISTLRKGFMEEQLPLITKIIAENPKIAMFDISSSRDTEDQGASCYYDTIALFFDIVGRQTKMEELEATLGARFNLPLRSLRFLGLSVPEIWIEGSEPNKWQYEPSFAELFGKSFEDHGDYARFSAVLRIMVYFEEPEVLQPNSRLGMYNWCLAEFGSLEKRIHPLDRSGRLYVDLALEVARWKTASL